MSRYDDRTIFVNNTKQYAGTFEKRGVTKLKHFATPKLTYPTAQQMSSLEMRGHTWKTGDRFYKLAHTSYGDATLWWVVAFFNKTPTETHVKNGDVIQIPFPLERALSLLGV